jgi:Caleosin related protein
VADKRAGSGARSALELHAHFFDLGHEDAITIGQAARGMTALGLPWLFAAPLAVLVVVSLGYLTRGKPSSTISVPDIVKGKHPFETGVFGAHGELDAAAFEQLFLAPHCRTPRDRVTYGELRARVLERGDPRKPFGLFGSLLARLFSAAELFTLFCLASDCKKQIGDELRPALSRKTLRRFYEGRLFPVLARRWRIASLRGAP